MALYAHIGVQPSAINPEQHTFRQYDGGLKYFLNFIGPRLSRDDLRTYATTADLIKSHNYYQQPTPQLVKVYLAHLKECGYKSSTISSRYMAPVRIFLPNHPSTHPPTGADDQHAGQPL